MSYLRRLLRFLDSLPADPGLALLIWFAATVVMVVAVGAWECVEP